MKRLHRGYKFRRLPARYTDWVQQIAGEGVTPLSSRAGAITVRETPMTMQGIYQYKLVDGKVVERTPEEILVDFQAIPAPPPSDHEIMMSLLGVE